MKNLISVIGLAPSEMPREDLVQLIRAEHQRVSDGVESYTPKSKRKASGGPRAPSGKALLAKLKEKGVTLEQYQEMVEVERRIKELEAKIGTNSA